jgi:hypothetical protein
MRLLDEHLSVIVLTNSDNATPAVIAERVALRYLPLVETKEAHQPAKTGAPGTGS